MCKIQAWGLDKNLKAEEVLAMFRCLQMRQADGKLRTEFIVRGRKTPPERLRRYLSRAPHLRQRLERGEMPSVLAAGEVDVRTPSPSPSPALRFPRSYLDIKDSDLAAGEVGFRTPSRSPSPAPRFPGSCLDMPYLNMPDLYDEILMMMMGEWTHSCPSIGICY
jgi:hypothetical protein